MPLSVKLITEEKKNEYSRFLQRPNHKAHLTFLHTWEWGDFMKSNSLQFKRIGVYDGIKLVAVGQCALKKLKLGTFWYCPRGLVLDYEDQELVKGAYEVVKVYFKD